MPGQKIGFSWFIWNNLLGRCLVEIEHCHCSLDCALSIDHSFSNFFDEINQLPDTLVSDRIN